MDLSLNEEQKQIKALVRQFCNREVDQKRMMEILRKNDAVRTIEEIKANFPWDLIEKAHNAGLRTIGIPTKYGGPGPDTDVYMTLAVATEEAGYSGGLVAEILIGPNFLNQAMRSDPDYTEEEREQQFSKLLEFKKIIVGCTISEPDSSVDAHLPYDEGGSKIGRVTARKDGNEWVIDGQKMWSSHGAIADVVEVVARTKDGPYSESMSMFELPVDTPGVSRTLNKLIYQGFEGNGQFNYDNVRVPEDALQGKLHQFWKREAYAFQFKTMVRSFGVGLAMRLFEHMVDYAKQRVAGGKPIIQHTDVAAILGDLSMQLEALRAFNYKAAWESDQMEKSGALTSKYGNWYWYCAFLTYLRQVSWRMCEVAHDIYGSLAGSEELPVDSFLRYNYMWRGTAFPDHMGLVRAMKDWDTRYHET